MAADRLGLWKKMVRADRKKDWAGTSPQSDLAPLSLYLLEKEPDRQKNMAADLRPWAWACHLQDLLHVCLGNLPALRRIPTSQKQLQVRKDRTPKYLAQISLPHCVVIALTQACFGKGTLAYKAAWRCMAEDFGKEEREREERKEKKKGLGRRRKKEGKEGNICCPPAGMAASLQHTPACL